MGQALRTLSSSSRGTAYCKFYLFLSVCTRLAWQCVCILQLFGIWAESAWAVKKMQKSEKSWKRKKRTLWRSPQIKVNMQCNWNVGDALSVKKTDCDVFLLTAALCFIFIYIVWRRCQFIWNEIWVTSWNRTQPAVPPKKDNANISSNSIFSMHDQSLGE